MSSEMPIIDISGIEALRVIKTEQDTMRSRLEKMVSMKDQVNPAVYEKVFREYSSKLDEIAANAEPIKNGLRGQYRILRGLIDRLSDEIKQLELEREELDFRHTLGEFGSGFFDDEIKKWQTKHNHKKVEREDAEEMNQAFLAVFDGPDDLEGDVELRTIPVQKMVAAPVPQAAAMNSPAPPPTLVYPPEPEPEPVRDVEPDLGLGNFLDQHRAVALGDETLPPEAAETVRGVQLGLMPDLPDEVDADLGISPLLAEDLSEDDLVDDLDELNDLDGALEEDDLVDELDEDTGELPPIPAMDESTRHGDEVAMPPLPQDRETLMMETLPVLGAGGGEGETMIIATPKLVSVNNATEGTVIQLGMGTTSLGRSPDNDIHVTEDRVSRKHCQITFGPGGYALYDLNSENGSFVNGQRIREHFLQDGDIIQVGTFKYLYRDH